MIEEMASTTSGAQLKLARKIGTGTTISAEGEEGLVEWVNSLREEGVPVSRLMLQLRAKGVAKDEDVVGGVFDGRWVWQQSFLKRHGLTLRVKIRQGQKAPAEMQQEAHEFWVKVEQIRCELGVNKVYNADQSGTCFECLPKKTISKRVKNSVADSDGNQYPPFFVMKTKPSTKPATTVYNNAVQHGFGSTLWKEIKPLMETLGVRIYGDSSAWWNAELFVQWFDFHFACRSDDEPILLLWGDFSCHWTEEVEAHTKTLDVYLLKAPSELTSVCQHADILWFRPLKQRLRQEWVQHLNTQLSSFNVESLDEAFKLIALRRSAVIIWATTAWGELGSKVVTSGFKGLIKAWNSAVSTKIQENSSELNALESDSIESTEDSAEDTANEIVARLEDMIVNVDMITESDYVVEQFIDGAMN